MYIEIKGKSHPKVIELKREMSSKIDEMINQNINTGCRCQKPEWSVPAIQNDGFVCANERKYRLIYRKAYMGHIIPLCLLLFVRRWNVKYFWFGHIDTIEVRCSRKSIRSEVSYHQVISNTQFGQP